MISSRSLEDLHPTVRTKATDMLARCREAGIELLVTCTYRDGAAQNALYAQGRTTPGGKRTNARAGESLHNYHLAFDVVPMRTGKPVWGTTGEDGKLWNRVGAIGEACGLEWAGRWKTFKEFPHFQFAGGLSLADLKVGKMIT